MASQSFNAARDAISRIVRDHWKFFLIEGVILTVLGFFAVVLAVMTGFTVTVVFGWLFMISGIVGMIITCAMRRAPRFRWSLLSAVLGILVGGWMLIQPALGLVSLTYLLIAYFIVEGIATIMLALERRGALPGRWDGCL
jgi:uncharacterized membrane protein HdeD (DUF308 family)